MTAFVDRQQELRFLEGEFAQDRASLVVLYGRRRIGKTTLIQHFIQNKPALYFVATEESERENRRNFQQAVAAATENWFLQKDILLDWEEIFAVLVEHQPNTRMVIALDEFQYLGKTQSAFPSVLQKIWDQMLAQANVMVILCGSLVGMMVEQTLAYSSPLYGRRTGQIRLGPIAYSEYTAFFPPSTTINRIEHYAVTGGVPKYVELFPPTPDIFQAIENTILSKQSFLYEEPLFLLDKAFVESGTYFSLLKTIAAGHRKLGKIASALGIGQSNLTRYLKTLQDLDLIARDVPVTETQPQKSKKGLYRITDHFLAFWFCFVHPFRNSLEIENPAPALRFLREQFRPSHVSFVYEDICRQWLLRHGLAKAPHLSLLHAGRWWDKNTEIDIVGFSEDPAEMIVGECKYLSRPVDTDVYLQLTHKAQLLPTPPKATLQYVLFSQSGFTPALRDLAREDPTLHLETISA